MNIRGFAFWTKDRILGKNRIKKALTDVESHSNNGIENRQQLDAIVEWAMKEVPFYQKYQNKSFEELPIVNKQVIRENFEEFKARPFVGMKLHAESTSGSTGTPFTIYQDAGKRLRAAADSLYMSEAAGFHIGTKLYYVRVWTDLNRKSPLQCMMKNIVLQDSSSLSENSMEQFLKTLETDKSEKSILSYASTITTLYRWMQQTGRTTSAKVASIITMSESLPSDVKSGMQELFGCPVVSRYSNQECGLISQQRMDGDEYAINTGSFYVELLKLNSDEAAADGELGRIVITDLYNKAMPMLRYDTGDLGYMSHVSKNGVKGKYLSRIEGRSNDMIYSTSGEMLSHVTVSVGMWKFHDLKQWLFIQNDTKEYEIQLKCTSNPYTQENEIVEMLKYYVGNDAQIKVTYVDDIPLLKSGKRKYIINNMKK